MSGSRRASGWIGVFFVAALVLATAPAALAHAAYKDSPPADGETVASPPSQITAEFTEPMTDSSWLKVFDPCGNQVDNNDSQVSTSTMTVSMSADKAGEYTVEFAAQSVDTHVTYGSFSFTASDGALCPDEEPEDPRDGGGGDGGGGSGGGGGGSGSGSGAGSGSGSEATSPETGGPMASGGGDGGSRGKGAHAQHRKQASKKKSGDPGPSAQGRRKDREPVPFENTGDRAPGPSPWDLPMGGVVMALALCVMIGAAGGRVYAGIVAPPRR